MHCLNITDILWLLYCRIILVFSCSAWLHRSVIGWSKNPATVTFGGTIPNIYHISTDPLFGKSTISSNFFSIYTLLVERIGRAWSWVRVALADKVTVSVSFPRTIADLRNSGAKLGKKISVKLTRNSLRLHQPQATPAILTLELLDIGLPYKIHQVTCKGSGTLMLFL